MEEYSRRTLEDIYWIGMIYNILDLPLVQRITSLSQPGVLRSMPYELYQSHIGMVKNELLKKFDSRFCLNT
jgi:hypothetical protein